MSRSLNDIIKRSGFGEKMGIKLKQKKKRPLSEGYIKAAVGKTSGIKIENYSLKSTINEIINYKRGIGEDGPMSLGTLGDKLGSAFKTIWDKIVEIFETIWKFLTSQLGAFWDWITGKGKEATKKAIEAKFYEVSGGEVGERLALPAPAGSDSANNNTSLMSRTSSDLTNTGGKSSVNGGGSTSTNVNNNSRIGYNQTSRIGMNGGNGDAGKTSNGPTGGTPNSSKNISLPRIFVDEEFHNGFKKALSAIIQKFEMEGNNISSVVEKLSSVNSSKLISDIKSGETGENSKKVGAVLSVLVYGKEDNMDFTNSNVTENNAFFNSLEKMVRNAEGYAYEDKNINPDQVKPAYSKWKLLEKLIDNVCARMESYKSSAERAVSAVTKLAKDLSKALSDNRTSEGLNDEGRKVGKDSSSKIMELATKCGNEFKTGLTNLGKDMKKLIDALKPKG